MNRRCLAAAAHPGYKLIKANGASTSLSFSRSHSPREANTKNPGAPNANRNRLDSSGVDRSRRGRPRRSVRPGAASGPGTWARRVPPARARRTRRPRRCEATRAGIVSRPARVPAASTSRPVCAEGSRHRRKIHKWIHFETAISEVAPDRSGSTCGSTESGAGTAFPARSEGGNRSADATSACRRATS
jgi:hypothetical protein